MSESGTTGYSELAVIELLKALSAIDRKKIAERTAFKGKDFSMAIAVIKIGFS